MAQQSVINFRAKISCEVRKRILSIESSRFPTLFQENVKMVDYSKWKNIEISDDEDDTHPNVDTPSLFRWRHKARVERMEEDQKAKEDLQKQKEETIRKEAEIRRKMKDQTALEGDMSKLNIELSELEKQLAEFKQKEAELAKKEKLAPWNVDTISKDGFTKTVINVPKPRVEESLTEEEREERQRKFVNENEKLLKKYGMLRKYDDSKDFLNEHKHLVCEETANYLVVWCISLEMEKKHDLMEHVAHQTIAMQYVLELGKQLKIDPRACVSSFFTKIQVADKEYADAFHDEIRAFKERIRTRAKEKLAKLIEEQEEEDRLARLGPGGLDPLEVLQTLPAEMQACFEAQDKDKLKEVIAKMPEEEVQYHMKRCIDSGLWLPEGGSEDEGGKAVEEDTT